MNGRIAKKLRRAAMGQGFPHTKGRGVARSKVFKSYKVAKEEYKRMKSLSS